MQVKESRGHDLPTRLHRFVRAGGEARPNLPDHAILDQEIQFSVQVICG